MPRIILVSGKGGTGKTTVASATGLATAKQGYRTLVISFDIAHSLSDAFDLERGLFDQNQGLPLRVTENLDLQEVDVQEDVERHWGDVYRYLATIFTSTGLSSVAAEELAIIPGMEDVVTLLYLNQYMVENTYDVLIVDCAPTGESLRFVSMPTTLEWYMRKIFGIERNVMRAARPIAKMLTDVPLPDESYFAAIQRLFKRIEGIENILLDPETTTIRLVTNPEKMVVRETQRAYMYFGLYGMNTDQIIINRVFPEQAGVFSRLAARQTAYTAEIAEYFQPVPVTQLPLFEDEIIGMARLQEVGHALYGDEDPSQCYISSPSYTFKKDGQDYLLEVVMPFVQKEEIDLTRQAEDLVIRVGNFKRHVPLPRSVVRLKTAGAKMDDGRLIVRFVNEVSR
ncbi:ArsA family ATPase [Candidatus Entotheonella palauensis]|uniref:ArsA family ATPase n=1 Tax=Candidatus Entotheonella palauensis TaxID=93172 RepID=UPI000B7F675B|nr:TRC40/GET3/ArsA family transport-energizing ATPase [Candidatus Entotheonella palauensis]